MCCKPSRLGTGSAIYSFCYPDGMPLASTSSIPASTLNSPAKPPKLCAFVDATTGANCNTTKLIARGYCSKHYRALDRRGTFASTKLVKAGNVATTPANIDHNTKLAKRARKLLEKNAPSFVKDWIIASQISALKGDHDAAKDGLLHARMIAPVISDARPTTATQINIGVKLGGMGGVSSE